MRRILLLLAALGCSTPEAPEVPKTPAAPAPTQTAPTAQAEAPPTPAPKVKAPRPIPPSVPPSVVQPKEPEPAWDPVKLPPSQRVWAVSLDGTSELHHVVGAHKDQLWAWDPDQQRELWRVRGPAVAQMVAVGDIGKGRRLYVAWGVGRDYLRVPLVLQSLDPATGQGEELWRFDGERTEAAHLSVSDVDRDGKPELAFAYYISKYFVKTRHIEGDGKVIEGPEIRMASSRAFGDLDGKGGVDELIGRVYGDEKGMPGDFWYDLGKGRTQIFEVAKGVKDVAFVDLGGKRPTALISDGWVSNYGAEARARLVRVRMEKGKPAVELVGESPDEFTFFDIAAADLDGDGKSEVVVRGNKRVSAFTPQKQAPWPRRELVRLEPVLNTALGKLPTGRWAVYVPGGATRFVRILQ